VRAESGGKGVKFKIQSFIAAILAVGLPGVAFGAQDVVGPTLPGVAPAGAGTQPILPGALDDGGLLQPLHIDGSGNLKTTASISGSVTVNSSTTTYPASPPSNAPGTTGVPFYTNTAGLLECLLPDLSLAQNSTTSGQLGPLIQGAVTSAAPTYTTAKTSPLSLTTGGLLRTSVGDPLPAGTNVIGHTINDTGSTTAVTGNVTVVQTTGTNLHAVLDTTSTTAVTQATASNLNAQVVGDVASAATDGGNPVKVGMVGKSADPTAVTTGQRVNAYGDLNGKIVVSPYALHDNYSSATVSTASATTAQLAANATSGVSIYITGIYIANTGSTASLVSLLPHSGSTLIATINPAGGGSNITLTTPIKVTAATALDYTTASASTTQYITVTYYLGP